MTHWRRLRCSMRLVMTGAALLVACGETEATSGNGVDTGSETGSSSVAGETDSNSGTGETGTDAGTETGTESIADEEADVASFVVSDAPQKEALAEVVYNPTADEFVVIWQSEPASLDGDLDCRILGRRVSTSGAPIGEAFVISQGPQKRIMAKAAYNTISNQIFLLWGQQGTKIDLYAAVIAADGTSVIAPAKLPVNQTADHVHTSIAFDETHEQLLVTFDDNRHGTGNDLYGILLDKSLEVVQDEFSICAAAGNQFNPFVAYDAQDDVYLMNWEDFRFVDDWQKPGNIIGALISADGELLAEDIPIMEDHGLTNEGDQRFNAVSYNPVAHAFLTTWSDTRPDWMNAAIGARFVKSDGTVEGEAFPIVDFSGAQMIAYPVFVEALPGYLVAYEHDDKDLDVHYFMDTTAQLDVRVLWVDEAGTPLTDTPLRLAVGEANQRFVRAALGTESQVALVVWQEDAGKTSDPTGHMTATGGNILAAILEATPGG